MHLHAASLAVLDDNAILDSSGTDGVQDITATDHHADGTNASSVWVSTANFQLPTPLEVKAAGGNGAVGYSSSDSSVPPSAGGNAGNGADVTLVVNTQYDNVADKAELIITDTNRTPDQKIGDMTKWAQFAQLVTDHNKPDSISWVYTMRIDENQPDMDPDGPLPHAINANTFQGLMANTVRTLRETSSDFMSKIDCRPGTPGNGGIMGGSTKRAPDGVAGKPGNRNYSTYSERAIISGTELVFHPDQVRFTLRDIENSYFIGTQASITEAVAKLKALTGRLSLLAEAKPTDNIYQTYVAHEFKTLAVLPSGKLGVSAAFNSLTTSLKLANQYMVRIDQGHDFYQNDSSWVPRGSYQFYEDSFQTVLADFDSVESNYIEYQKLAADTSKRSEQVDRALAAARSGEKQAEADLTALGVDLSDTAGRIAVLQDDIPRKHKAVDNKLTELANKINTSVQWPTMKEFLGAAGQMAFCSSPEMAMGMFTVQGATLLNTSLTEIHDNAGNAVSKEYVVGKIRALGSGLDGLVEALKASANDPDLNVDDPGASKLLGQENDIMGLVKQYRGVLGGDLDDFKKLFDDYVNTVLQRNNQVMHYNNVITVFLQTRTKLNSYANDQLALGTQEAQLVNSDIPGLASIVQSSYLDYTAKVLQLLYDTRRALTFWTLNSGTVQLSSLRDEDFPSPGLGARLKTLKGDIITDFGSQTDALGIGRQPFGVPGGPGGQPKIVELDEWQLELLKMPPSKTGQEFFTTIQINPVTKDTSLDDNVFATNADVRISNVRVYLEGAKTDNSTLNFKLQHLGDEQIVTVKNETRRFTHDRLVFTFEYNLVSGAITRDGRLDLDPEYALPGPFATWRIGVSPLANKNLDLSNVTRAWVEFSGWSRSFR